MKGKLINLKSEDLFNLLNFIKDQVDQFFFKRILSLSKRVEKIFVEVDKNLRKIIESEPLAGIVCKIYTIICDIIFDIIRNYLCLLKSLKLELKFADLTLFFQSLTDERKFLSWIEIIKKKFAKMDCKFLLRYVCKLIFNMEYLCLNGFAIYTETDTKLINEKSIQLIEEKIKAKEKNLTIPKIFL